MKTGFIFPLWFFLVSSAHAAGLAVSPVTVTLDPSNQTALIKVTNGSNESARYQLEMKTWNESTSGEMQLAPTTEVIFFPQLLTLEPGASHNIRVGVTSPPSAVERTYRLFIQELPKPRPPGAKNAVQVLTRVGIPIFVGAGGAAPRVEVSGLDLKKGTIQAVVANHGTGHARPASVTVSLLDGQGGQIFQKQWDGWYILANHVRDYSAQVPSDQCKKAVNLRADVLGLHLSVSRSVPVDPKNCGP